MAIRYFIVLLVSFIMSNTGKSQTYLGEDKYRVGLKAGPSASLLLGNALSKPSVNMGFTGGMYFKYKLKGGFHFQTEVSATFRGARFKGNADSGYNKFSLFYMDAAQLVLYDLQKGKHTHAAVLGVQPSFLIQSWVYSPYYQYRPAARTIALNGADVFVVFGYHYNKKLIGIQSVFKIGLTNINLGLNMYTFENRHLGPTNNQGTIRNVSWETTLSF